MRALVPVLVTVLFLFFSCRSAGTDAVEVPILMYHDFTDGSAENAYTLTMTRFEEHLTALENAGYRSVTFADLIDYVYYGGNLPEKPVLLTCDDGYTGVPALAVPCAARHGMTVSCAVIGGLAGNDRHFSVEPVLPDSMELVSHTFALHDRKGWNGMVYPEIFPRYEWMLAEDCAAMKGLGGTEFPMMSMVLIYPHGSYSPETERILHSQGYLVTVTCDRGIAEIRRGDAESLYLLPRISVWQTMNGETLLEQLREP